VCSHGLQVLEDGSGDEGAAWDSEEPESDDGDGEDEEEAKPTFLPPSEVEAQLRALWREEKSIVTRIWGHRFGLDAKRGVAQEPGYVGTSALRRHVTACRAVSATWS
jgi:hypothetical protein